MRDEVAAGGLNFLWTNVPKMGLLLGLIVFRSASGVVASSAIAEQGEEKVRADTTEEVGVSPHLRKWGWQPPAPYEALYRLLGDLLALVRPSLAIVRSFVLADPAAKGRRHRRLAGSLAFVHTAAPAFFPNLSLPAEAVPGLLGTTLLLPASYCLGSALYARAQPVLRGRVGPARRVPNGYSPLHA